MEYSIDKNITLNDFLMLSVIGKGSYAKVVLVKKKDTNQLMALKILKKEMIEKRKQEDHVRIERSVLVIVSLIPENNNLKRLIPIILLSLDFIVLFKTKQSFISDWNIALEVNCLIYYKREDTSQKNSKPFISKNKPF